VADRLPAVRGPVAADLRHHRLLRRLRRDRRVWPSPSRSPEKIRALLQWHPLRALAARVGEPDRSGDIRKLFRRLDSRAVARPPRPHRHRRQDFASHSRQAKGPQSAAHAQRLRDQRPSHAGANQRAGEDQRDHGHSRPARSSGREETTRRRPRHHRRDGVSGRDKADFLLPLKGNQPTLEAEVEAYFETAPAEELVCKTTVEKDHGRIETRVFTASKVVDWIESEKSYPGRPRFKDIHTILHVLNRTEYADRCTFDTRIYISSAPLDIERLAAGSRGHWGVESMHWVLDVEFKDDLSRYRAGHGAKKTWP